MLWSSHRHSAGVALALRTPVIAACGLVVTCAIFIFAMFMSGAPAEKHLAVYSVAANYSLPLVHREGREYVGLLEILEPLGKVNAKTEGSRWRLHSNNTEGDFQVGKTRVRVQGRD